MATSLLNAGTAVPPLKPQTDSRYHMSLKCSGSKVRRTLSLHANQKNLSMNLMSQRKVLHICNAEGQTQTIERQTTKITSAPLDMKSPELDDGGAGFPPRDDDDGGDGGGGGGWGSGGFFLFGFFALLGLLKDNENDRSSSSRRR